MPTYVLPCYACLLCATLPTCYAPCVLSTRLVLAQTLEQCRRPDADGRADLHDLDGLVCEVLTGTPI